MLLALLPLQVLFTLGSAYNPRRKKLGTSVELNNLGCSQ